MRALKFVTILMAVMIVGGTALLGYLIARRVSTPTGVLAGPIALDEPSGTHITGIAPAGTSIALTLQGGGPDRVLILDPKSMKVTGRISLPR